MTGAKDGVMTRRMQKRIDAYRRVFDKAWPNHVGPSHSDRIAFASIDDDLIEPRHTGRGLPAPFHRGLQFGVLSSVKCDAQRDASVIAHVVTHVADLARDLLAASDRAHDIARKAGMTVGMLVPDMVIRTQDGSFSTLCSTTVTGLDDAGNPVSIDIMIGTSGMVSSGWRDLMRMAAHQEARREAAGRRLVADGVTAMAFARMRDRDRARLLDHLRRNPQAGNIAGATAPNWSEPSLRGLGLSMPDGMETVHVRDGRIVGKVRMAERTTWNSGKLLHRGEALPSTVLAAITGEPLSVLVSHPDLEEGMRIRRARMDGFGAIRADIECELREVL